MYDSKRFAQPAHDSEKVQATNPGKDPKSAKKAAEVKEYLDFVDRMEKAKGIGKVLDRGQALQDASKAKHSAAEPYREFVDEMKKNESNDLIQASHEHSLKRRGRRP